MHKSNIFHNAQEKHCLVYMSQVFGKRISNSSAGPTNEESQMDNEETSDEIMSVSIHDSQD